MGNNKFYLMINKKYNCGGPPAFKSEKKRYQSKNYCITINIKTVNSQYIFIRKTQVLGFHELKTPLPFLTRPIQNWLNQLQPSCICTSVQKIQLFHLFSFEIQSILESHDQTGHNHFWPYPPNKLLISF